MNEMDKADQELLERAERAKTVHALRQAVEEVREGRYEKRQRIFNGSMESANRVCSTFDKDREIVAHPPRCRERIQRNLPFSRDGIKEQDALLCQSSNDHCMGVSARIDWEHRNKNDREFTEANHCSKLVQGERVLRASCKS